MTDKFPSLDIYTPYDDTTVPGLIQYLEEFQNRRDALVHVNL